MISARGVAAGPVADLALAWDDGMHVALLGPNGSGKSTLLRLLNGAETPRAGALAVNGVRADGTLGARRELRRLVGLMRQDPRCQLVAGRVEDEVAFGPQNLGVAPSAAAKLAARSLAAVGLEGYGRQAAETLSGGELQRLALAGVLAMEPAWLAVDEPCAMLDEAARATVRGALAAAGERAGLIWATHYVREAAAADRVLLLGETPQAITPEELFSDPEALEASSLSGSLVADAGAFMVGHGLSLSLLDSPPRAVEALRSAGYTFPAPACGAAPTASGGLELDGVTVRAGRRSLLRSVSAHASRGSVTVLAGRSGSGKTTAARTAAGLLRPTDGAVRLDGRPVAPGSVGFCVQRPADQLFCDTVLEDVAFGPRQQGRSAAEAERCAERALERVGLPQDTWGLSPFVLSGGEARKAALAGVIACEPGAYVLDEPTAGLDGPSRAQVRTLVAALAADGAAVLVVSHDLDEWLDVASTVALLADGSVAWHGAASDALEPGIVEAAGLQPSLGLLLLREGSAA